MSKTTLDAQKESNANTAVTISVIYTCVDGAHFFTSEDKEVTGLCVASYDLAQAYNEVALQLNALYLHNQGVKRQFKPGLPLEKFEHIISSTTLARDYVDTERLTTPALLQPWLANEVLKASAQCG